MYYFGVEKLPQEFIGEMECINNDTKFLHFHRPRKQGEGRGDAEGFSLIKNVVAGLLPQSKMWWAALNPRIKTPCFLKMCSNLL